MSVSYNLREKLGVGLGQQEAAEELAELLDQVAVDNASFTIGAEAGNVINVAIQLELQGEPIAERCVVEVYLASDTTGDTIVATAPTGGMAIGTDGTILQGITVLTDNTTGTASNTLAALPTLTDSPATADALRDDLNTNVWPVLKNYIASLAAKINELVRPRRVLVLSEADGDIDINITDTAGRTLYVVVVLPSGKRVVSSAVTFAP